MPEHSLLIFAETASASFLNSWGSLKASGENRLRITYVAIRHLHAGISAVLLCFWRGGTSQRGLPRWYQTGAKTVGHKLASPWENSRRGKIDLCGRITLGENARDSLLRRILW